MTNINADVIRVWDTESNLPIILRAGMLGATTDTDKLVAKRLSDSSIYKWSDDTKQLLLAGAQTVTGVKTFSSGPVVNALLKTNSIAFQSELTQPDNGGANEGAGGDVTLSSEGTILFNPTAANVSFYNLAVSSSAGRTLILKNQSAYTVTLGLSANMQDGSALEISPNKSVSIMSDSSKWWKLDGADLSNAILKDGSVNMEGDWTCEQEVYVLGDLGVGTNTPTNELTIYKDTGNCSVDIISKNDSLSILNLGDTDDFNISRIQYDHSDNSLSIYTNNSKNIVIDSSGNLGINDTTPSYKLDVNGTLRAVEAATFDDDAIISTSGKKLIFEDTSVSIGETYTDGSSLILKSLVADGSVELDGYEGVSLRTNGTEIATISDTGLAMLSGYDIKVNNGDINLSTSDKKLLLGGAGYLYGSGSNVIMLAGSGNIIFNESASEIMRLTSGDVTLAAFTDLTLTSGDITR